jgi:hypothetical protein
MKQASFTKPLSVSFTQKIFQEIKTITDEQKISMAQWVRTACEKALTEKEASEGGPTHDES